MHEQSDRTIGVEDIADDVITQAKDVELAFTERTFATIHDRIGSIRELAAPGNESTVSSSRIHAIAADLERLLDEARITDGDRRHGPGDPDGFGSAS